MRREGEILRTGSINWSRTKAKQPPE